MKPTVPQIQTQSLHGHASLTHTSSSPTSTEQMLIASRSPLSPSKRPKLSLQTTTVPVAVGKSTTSLTVSLSALPSASPTIRNTFNNAYDIPLRPSPIGVSPSTKWPKSLASTITRREEQPYDLPSNVRSILRNSPYVSSIRRPALSATNSASPRTGRRVFFPPVKRVTYRTPMEEEIRTFIYTARHSDLSSEGESDREATEDTAAEENDPLHPPTPRASEEVSCKQNKLHSPILTRGKRKRKPREWHWTLGSVDNDETTTRRSVATPHPQAHVSLDNVTTDKDIDQDVIAEEEGLRKDPPTIQENNGSCGK